MLIIKSIDSYKEFLINHKCKSIGFVPTMGYLHEGHISLVRRSKAENDITVVSIYVNPLQFGPKEDFAKYPRNLAFDQILLEKEKVDVLFLPDDIVMYPSPMVLGISVEKDFASKLCGKNRPDHFQGVAVVVLKLFNIIFPTTTYFGLKDYQQFMLIKRLIRDFNLDINITGIDTVREDDGLAKSSRNSYLLAEERMIASSIYKALILVHEYIKTTPLIDSHEVDKLFSSYLRKISPKFKVQYIEVYNRDLLPIDKYIEGQMFLGTAVFLGNVRLIDNLIF